MTSNRAAVGTVLLSMLSAVTAGIGLAFLVTIIGTVLVVVLAYREQNDKAREARRRLLRDAAWRETERGGVR